MSRKPSPADRGSGPSANEDRAKDVREAAQPVSRSDDAAVSDRASRQPDGRKGILVRARPEAWKALKLIALDSERTLQAVMTEAINDVLSKHGKPPVA